VPDGGAEFGGIDVPQVKGWLGDHALDGHGRLLNLVAFDQRARQILDLLSRLVRDAGLGWVGDDDCSCKR
jgi:hypothetical protein